MAQEPSSKDLLEAVKQQESGGRRYKADGKTLLEGPQTKYGTAKGEMQVLDMTTKDPGYGVKPAQDDSPDERARVGRDYLRAMVNKYGNKETALVAYNWGPGNTDKWLEKGGDFTKLPKETQNYVTKITGALGSTKLAQATPTTKPKSGIQKAVYKAAPLTHPMLSQLGPNYQAAMAVSMLADEDEKEGKSEDEQSESQKMLTEVASRPVALASADLSYQSPFPELSTGIAGAQKSVQPVKMAAGGVPYAPTASVRPSARAQLNDVKSQWDAFNNKATDYNTKADEYNKQVADYQKLVDAYNAGPRTEDFTGKEPTFTYTAPTEPTTSAEQYQAMADAAKKDVARRSMALSVASNPEQYGLSMNKFFADGGEVDYFQDPMGAPSAPITEDTFVRGKEFKAADALKAAKEVGRGVARNVKSIAQGVSETPYNLVGSVADVGNLALTPFGLGSKEPMLGSEHLKRLALEAGIRQAPPTNPQDQGMYMMGELGSSLVNPGPIAAKVGQATEKAVTTGGKAVANEMLRGMEGQGVLAPISPQGAIMYAVPPERPFIGRLDEFVDSIKNPVQLGQLKGQLKGKFRDYDLERVERAFTGMDDKTKLTPDQIKQALAGTHSPSRWISETLPPEQGKFHQGQDNVWGAPLGTTNLYLEQPPEKAAASKLFDQAAASLGRLGPKSSRSLNFDTWMNAKLFLQDKNVAKYVDPEVINGLNQKLEKVRPSVVSIENASTELNNINNGMLWPALYKNPEAAQGALGGQPYFRFTEEAEKAIRQNAIQEKMAQGMDELQAMIALSKDDNFYRQMRDQSQRIAVQKVHELALQDMQKMGIKPPDMSKIRLDLPLPEGVSAPDYLPRSVPEFKASVENALEPTVQQINEAEKRIRSFLSSDINLVGETLDKYRPYEGKHRYITTQPHPIGFTRFSEHEATIPGMGPVQGRHFHELQSDLSKDMRATGSTYGNAAKDQAEYDRLNEEVRKIRYQSFPDTGEFSDVNEFNKAQNKWEAAQDTKIQSMEKRIKVLGERIRGNPSYNLEEPFAGFETNQMVRQQLLMKNAIQAAMRDGKSFATFPGNESARPQLYAGKVLPNLKQAIKDLGGEKAGFELRQIELPPDKNGRPITATGVVWSPEAAARISEKGVPFAKGGSVERLSADNRRYL